MLPPVLWKLPELNPDRIDIGETFGWVRFSAARRSWPQCKSWRAGFVNPGVLTTPENIAYEAVDPRLCAPIFRWVCLCRLQWS